MRFPRLGVGRLLGSVALRYGHPGMMGESPLRWSRGKSGCRGVVGVGCRCDGGVVVPRDEQLTRLEATVFLSQQPQSSRRLAQLAGLADGTKARTLVRTLNRRYDAEGSAFRVEEVAGGFQLMTRAKFAPWLRRLHVAPAEVRLSGPAMETLAVVAYRQPVLRAEIEAIRGVQSGEVLRQLIEHDLVRIAGRSDELGRPFLYGTTKQFLQVFGLRHLDELPRAEVLRVQQPLATREYERPIDSDADTQNSIPQSFIAEEETNVKTLPTIQPRQPAFAEDQCPTVIRPRHDDRPGNQGVFDKQSEDEDEEYDDALDEEDEDDIDDEDEEEEEEDDEDLDDEPWEEVEDEDEEEDEDEDFDDEDEEWDEDEDWEDDDEDWDEDDDEWDDDEEEDEEEEEKGEEE
jgi:segregation and condensation protein B